jgi:hypothetical protein
MQRCGTLIVGLVATLALWACNDTPSSSETGGSTPAPTPAAPSTSGGAEPATTPPAQDADPPATLAKQVDYYVEKLRAFTMAAPLLNDQKLNDLIAELTGLVDEAQIHLQDFQAGDAAAEQDVEDSISAMDDFDKQIIARMTELRDNR